MIKALPEDQLKSVYDKVSGWYDWQHSIVTFNSDQKGRKLVVSKTVTQGDNVIDAGAGTGTTALLAAQSVGPEGSVVLYDFSREMLKKAKEKAVKKRISDRLIFATGDMASLPYEDCSFDVALSTYSLCPLFDPAKAALELYRIVKPGGKIGIAHSTEPSNKLVRGLANAVEKMYWKIPELSLGCRAVKVLPALREAGGNVIFKKRLGFPLWPFLVFVIEKPI
ncbi:MAG: class I SAM-dependent methyltransferase [Balneolaceae bacterium]|jgi:demethylmenaquinone methyltransferase/2-methoxy-6-polyprenyl-1,4-benzoquinol methylase